MLEHEYEPLPGLPGNLPQGETLLWQGAPRWRSLGRFAFHDRKLVLYFVVLLGWYAIATTLREGVLAAAGGTALFAGLALLAVAFVEVLAWLVARTTLYTITSHRVVMRFGIALPITINLPFKVITAAALKTNSDGTGDLQLALAPTQKVSYFMLWPHIRSSHFFVPKPVLRAVPNAAKAAAILGRALASANGQSVPVMADAAASAGQPDATVPA